MPSDGDIAELAEKAKVLAEASGRTEEDVMGDLLDDGVLNESNQKGDLIEQAQEKVDRFRKLMASMIPLDFSFRWWCWSRCIRYCRYCTILAKMSWMT